MSGAVTAGWLAAWANLALTRLAWTRLLRLTRLNSVLKLGRDPAGHAACATDF